MAFREIPRGMQFWPERQLGSTESAHAVVKRYKAGFAGAWRDKSEDEKLKSLVEDRGGSMDGEAVCTQYGMAESGKGKLSLSFIPAMLLWPQCMPGPPQRRGDCVSHGQKNACMISIAAEIMAGIPDEITGIIEGPPTVSPTAEKAGVFSTEAIYWWRRHGGDGWSCSSSAQVVIRESGVWVRRAYTKDEAGVDVDLTRYSASTAGKWGRTPPPNDVKKFGLHHNIRTATEAKSREPLRDLIANYYGVNHCGSQGLSSKRDENGRVRRSGSWAHAMSWIGVDDRPWAHEKYGDMLFLNLNSWGSSWVSGPRDIHDSADHVPADSKEEWTAKGIVNPSTGNIMIPKGSAWVTGKDMINRYHVAAAGASGWKPKDLTFHKSPFER